MEQKRKEKVTSDQKEILVEFMIDHLDFARNKLVGPEGKITSNNLWLVLSEQLNAAGPEKNITKWQRVWVDFKMKVKKKASAIYSSLRRTGGGPEEDIKLSEVEEKVLHIISNTAVFGITNPDGVVLDSEEPLPVPAEEPRPGTSGWVYQCNAEEKEASESIEILSSTTEAEVTGESENEDVEMPPKKKQKKSTSAQAADDFRQIGQSTFRAIENVNKNLGDLNSKINKIIEQNDKLLEQNREVLEEKKNTNILLMRIAQALEGNYAENNI